jgi:Bacterial archaeo-eukaryotic release factor family 3
MNTIRWQAGTGGRAGMADLLRPEHVRELIRYAVGPCVSVFLPTHRVTPDSGQDPIRLRNLLDEAEKQLVAAGLRAPVAREVLRPGRDLLGPGRFWSYQSDGLAVFLAPGWSRIFRLPEEFGELVVVADRFHVKPLLTLLAAGHRFYVLALSQNQVRLLEGTPHGVQEVELAGVPQNLREALKYDDLEKELGLHVAGRGGPGARVVFHGHGAGGEVDKALLERFLRQVDDGLRQVLKTETAPLVLAAVDYEQAMFRQLTRYPHVIEQGIRGNPEQLRPAELHERAWTIVEPVFTRARQQAAQRYQEAAGRGQGAVWAVTEVVRAALQGQVDTLFVAVGEQRWGTADPQTLQVRIHDQPQPGDEDLLDRAAVHTLLTSGSVFAVPPQQVPGPGPAAALLRY